MKKISIHKPVEAKVPQVPQVPRRTLWDPTARQLVAELRRRGVHLSIVDGQIELLASPGVIDGKDLSDVRQVRNDVLAFLEAEARVPTEGPILDSGPADVGSPHDLGVGDMTPATPDDPCELSEEEQRKVDEFMRS